jgi:hypothetical protein
MKTKTFAQIKAECKADGLVYDMYTKKCRPSKRISNTKNVPQTKTVSKIKSKSPKKTVAQIKEECKADGLVYDRYTKKCRPSKRISHTKTVPQTKTVSKIKSKSPKKTVAQIKEECKADGLVYDRYTKKCRPSKRISHTKTVPQTRADALSAVAEAQEAAVDSQTVFPVGPGIPVKFNPIVDDCMINESWNRGKLLGKGQYGSTYIACHIDKPKKCDFVLKVQKDSKEFHAEVHALVELKNTGVVVKIYAAWTCKGEGFIIMEKVFPCKSVNDSSKYKKIKSALKIILNNGWLHLDVHIGNIMCKKDGSIVLIDFGYAVKKGKDNYPDHNFSKQLKYKMTFDQLEIVQKWHTVEACDLKDDPKYISYKNEYSNLMLHIIHTRSKTKWP